MSYSVPSQPQILSLTLDGFEGPIDLLLSLARDHKIDLSKLSILPLAEQYLDFLDHAIKKDIDVAAEYLVMGAWLAFLKSKILLPINTNEDLSSAQEMSELLELQLRRLEAIQKVSKLLFKSHQLGVHFFKRGNPEFFKNNQKVRYNLSLFDLIKSYGKIISNDNSKSITIAKSKLYVVEEAVKSLRNLISKTTGWKNLFEFLPHNIIDNLENRSAVASYFVASLELAKEGRLSLKQQSFKDEIYLISRINL
ncbi:ScpA family protein [Alphaproteobacteria bacterium]|nr:ScpA family protein [Alphaproteobacteria bacterium]